MVADTALGRSAAEVVLDPEAGEDLNGAVVHLYGEVDRKLAFRFAQNFAQPRGEIEVLCSQIELALGDVPGVDRGCDLLCRHRPDTLHCRVRHIAGGAPVRCVSSGRKHLLRDGPDDVAAAFRNRTGKRRHGFHLTAV